MDIVILFMSHLISAILTFFIFGIITSVYVGLPRLKYIFYISKAKNEDGINNFAKYLYRKTSIKNITDEDDWESFVPAAKALYCRRNQD